MQSLRHTFTRVSPFQSDWFWQFMLLWVWIVITDDARDSRERRRQEFDARLALQEQETMQRQQRQVYAQCRPGFGHMRPCYPAPRF